jgi:hypothetical protein
MMAQMQRQGWRVMSIVGNCQHWVVVSCGAADNCVIFLEVSDVSSPYLGVVF